MILDLIEKNKDITQREISESIGVAVSMVNNYLDDYERKGFIKRKYRSTKTVEYFVTKKGVERKKLLNINYLNASLKVYKSARENIVMFLNQVIEKGFKNILLYGAGEVAEIILDVIQNDKNIPLKVIAIIDDDVNRQNEMIISIPIISRDDIKNYEYDGILVSSYKHHEVIRKNLVDINYPHYRIIEFFE